VYDLEFITDPVSHNDECKGQLQRCADILKEYGDSRRKIIIGNGDQ
jgi:hypothetical protein